MMKTIDSSAVRSRLETLLPPLLETLIADFALPGVAVAVVANGALVYAQGFGVRNLTTREPVLPQTLFHLASVSKPFVATAIMQLVEQGKVDLAAPVVQYLPYFRVNDPRSDAISVQQLLTHTAGLGSPADYRWFDPEEDDQALERFVRSLADIKPAELPEGECSYSNTGFEVLGDVVAKVSGQSFEDYVQQHILAPLAMPTSTFLRSAVAPELATSPHVGAPLRVIPGAYPYTRAHAPSSTLHSSVAELANWMLANLAHGQLGATVVLPAEAHARMWQPRAATGDEGWGEHVGFSWFLGKYRDQRVIHHSGGDPGFESNLVLLPELNAGVVVLTNANTTPMGYITDTIIDILLGDEPQPTPLAPIVVPVAATLVAAGVDAASAQYQTLAELGRYDTKAWRFANAVWGAIELHHTAEVMALVKLWVVLQPDASEVHEMLGWAYVVQEDYARAAEPLRRALVLDPDNENAADLLEQIGADR